MPKTANMKMKRKNRNVMDSTLVAASITVANRIRRLLIVFASFRIRSNRKARRTDVELLPPDKRRHDW